MGGWIDGRKKGAGSGQGAGRGAVQVQTLIPSSRETGRDPMSSDYGTVSFRALS